MMDGPAADIFWTMRDHIKPGYLSLLPSGQAEDRILRLRSLLDPCRLCPRECGAHRLSGEVGFCKSGPRAVVASYCDHHGEEPPISGHRGSGTVFFSRCNLRCVFCQNHQISQPQAGPGGEETSAEGLASILLELQTTGCHNINFVSPTHFAPRMAEAVVIAAQQGLTIPIVYNTNGYDSLETLRLLEGIVDIYMPDLKYADDGAGEKCSAVSDYVGHARRALIEMRRQVGNLRLDAEGVAVSGLLVRHLVLPGFFSGTPRTLEWVAETLGPETKVSLMSQYFPANRTGGHPVLGRSISPHEYEQALTALMAAGLDHGWVQELASRETYRPDFAYAHPFER